MLKTHDAADTWAGGTASSSQQQRGQQLPLALGRGCRRLLPLTASRVTRSIVDLPPALELTNWPLFLNESHGYFLSYFLPRCTIVFCQSAAPTAEGGDIR